MPDHEDSLGGETLDGEVKADSAGQSLGDGVTMGGDTAAHSLGDQSTFGDAHVDDELFDDGMELVDLSSRYKEEGELGKGGMGEVTLATDTRLNRKVAIKRILGEAKDKKRAVARFLTEAQSIAALSHNNIVQIHDYGRSIDGPFLIMECVQGGSLLDKCKAGPIELDEAVNIFGQLCDGLSKAHAAGIIHRDIKPANVLMTEDGIPKLTDFGLAKDDTADTGMTMEGAVIGTLDFMPPEQRQAAELTDHRSDLWSLAVTFYQMLTGKSSNVINIASLPPKLQSVVAKALEESKEDRFQSAMEMREAILQAHSGKMDTSRSLGDGECPQCATRNASDNKHCDECGTSLKVECLSCKSSILIWKKACRECGAQQAPLVEKALSALKTIHDEAESLLAELEFDAAVEKAALMIQGEDLRLQQYASWHDEFSARLELSKTTELGRLEELVREALAHEKAYDYKAALQILNQVHPSLKQTTVETDLTTTAEEVTERLTTKQSRLKELEGIVSERWSKDEHKGLLPLVEELLSLKPDRPVVRKLRAQLVKREEFITFLKNGDYESALSLDPNNSKALAMKKTVEIKAALASGDFENVLTLDPEHLGALTMKKAVEIKAALASGDYESALSLDPNNSKALVMKKAVEIRAALASGDFETVLTLDPNNFEARGMKKAVEIKAALDRGDYENALSLDPNNSKALAMKKTADIKAALASGDFEAVRSLVNGLTTISVQVATALANFQGSLILNGLTSISVGVAEALAKHEGMLSLDGLTTISAEVAEALAKCRLILTLRGLTTISVEVAEALAKKEGYLSLDGLTSISVEVAEALAKHEGMLSLNGLTTISVEVAEALRKHLGKETGDLSLDGLTTISAEVAEALAKCRLILTLNGLTTISVEVAEALAKKEGYLYLNGLTSISVEVAAALAKHPGTLVLRGVTDLPVEVAAALAKHRGNLILDGLTNLRVEVAAALTKHEGTLVLRGMTNLSVELAAELAKHSGTLDLTGLRDLPVEVAAALAKCEGVLCLKSRSKPLVFTMPDHDAISKGLVLSELVSVADLLDFLNRQDVLLANFHEANPIDSLPALDDRSQLSPEEAAVYDRPISDLNLSARACKCMVRLRMNTIGELLRKTGDEMLECKNFGVVSLNEVREKLEIHGLKLRGD